MDHHLRSKSSFFVINCAFVVITKHINSATASTSRELWPDEKSFQIVVINVNEIHSDRQTVSSARGDRLSCDAERARTTKLSNRLNYKLGRQNCRIDDSRAIWEVVVCDRLAYTPFVERRDDWRPAGRDGKKSRKFLSLDHDRLASRTRFLQLMESLAPRILSDTKSRHRLE